MYISSAFLNELFSKDLENESHSKDSGIDVDALKGDQEPQEIDQATSIAKSKASYGVNASRPGSDQYNTDIYHWAESSTQHCALTFQPDTVNDVSAILAFISRFRLPFAIKSGGHTGNPGFSSSPGILIAMTRFNRVVYKPESQTAIIGAGQIWDNVYEKLAPHRVTVLGARVTHIGVAGFILGGGYSWQTNQFGLAIDTVTAFELVKPDGTIVNVTNASDPDLFFALRGGGNNFGIVTSITMKTFPQEPQVWGGTVVLLARDSAEDPEERERLVKIKKLFFAVQNFADTVMDPKAAVLASLGAYGPYRVLNLMAFYDGLLPPDGIFDKFKEIDPEETGSQWKSRSYPDLIKHAMLYEYSRHKRGAFDTVALSRYTTNLLQVMWDEVTHWVSTPTRSVLIAYSVEPVLPNILSHGSPSAYPCDRSVAFSPFPVYVSWMKSEDDNALQELTKAATARIRDMAIADGIAIGASYPNYAISETPLEKMYGTNVARLRAIKERVDPSNIMGLAGGFKF